VKHPALRVDNGFFWVFYGEPLCGTAFDGSFVLTEELPAELVELIHNT